MSVPTANVFIASDPLGSGLVSGLARPGGNLTGFSLFLGDDFSSKWLELLKEAVPNVSRVAVLWNPVDYMASHYVVVLQGASKKLGVVLQPQAISDPDQFEGAFATLVAGSAQALVVIIDPLTVRYRERIAELATKNRTGHVWIPRVCRCGRPHRIWRKRSRSL
jgi:putative tryptophan/tyrosine transport system substrate-binding protein